MLDDEPTLAPKSIGAYRLVSPLGQGGMGEVFLAWDERLKRNVAIKRIRADRTGDDGSRGRFRREARATAQLSHPAIVQVFDVLEDDDGDVIVMEYVEGRSLAQAIAAGDLDLPTTVRLVGEIAAGLGEAHGKGLVHRDLKPENVMLTAGPRPRAKILDFGLARALFKDALTNNPGDSLTASGAVVGTAYAMSPEQACGQSVDHRSDLFALGNLLYMTLTGIAPFRGENVLDTLRQVASRAPEPVTALRPDVPEALGDLTARLLAKSPRQRPQNAALVEAELHKISRALEDGSTPRAAAEGPPRTALEDMPTLMSGVDEPPHGDSDVQTVVRTLVLTDLVDSTRLVESLGDQRASEVFARHDRTARDLLERHDGREIDKSDGFLLLFRRPFDAIAYAIAYHRALVDLSNELDVRLAARAAVHLGEVVLRHNARRDVERGAKQVEVEGLAKPLTARLMSLAGPRQTLLSQSAFDLGRRAALDEERWDESLQWLAHGPYVVQGVDEPLDVFEVGVGDFAPLVAPADSEKARRAATLSDELVLGWRPAVGESIPRRPHWVLAERLGEGGFGEVWLARHKSGEVRVFKFCFEVEKLRGLKREVTLFRLLKEALGERDDIARILDWSFEEAPYFLEVEHTAGGSLVDWADTQGGLGKVPMETRLEIAAQVADALAAAHSVGILHKDVKPQNVLVTHDPSGRPRIQLTDFGIGLLTERGALDVRGVTVAGFTETELEGSGGGTRMYMAPELIEGKAATVQADVYSLGVMLYQVVVGDFSRVLAPGWRRDVEDEILQEDVARLVDGNAQHRPSSALEVAQSLRSLGERRLRRTAERQAERRHRRRRWMAGAAALVLLVTSIVAVQATLARREADRLRAQSERLRGEAEELVGFMLGDLQDKLKPIGRLDVLESAGEKVLEYFESLQEEDLSDQALARYAEALNQIGDVRMAQGDLAEAVEMFRASLAQTQALAARDPDNTEWLFSLGQSRFWVGNALLEQDDYSAALPEMQEYLEISLALLERQPENVDRLLEVAYAHNNVGVAMERMVDPAAIEHFRKASAVSESLAELEPSRRDFQTRRINAHLQVGHWHETRGGDLNAAMTHYQKACDVAERLSSQTPSDAASMRILALTHDHLGVLHLNTGNLESALQHFQRSLGKSIELIALDDSNVEWHELAAYSRINIATALNYMGRSRLALEHLKIGIETLEESFESSANGLVIEALKALFNRLGDVYLDTGEVEKAQVAARRALALDEFAGIHADRLSADSYILLGEVFAAQGLTGQADQAWEKALLVIESLSDDLRGYRIADPWARATLHLGRLEEARPVIFTLLGMGYREARFLELCAAKGWDIEKLLGAETTKGRERRERMKP